MFSDHMGQHWGTYSLLWKSDFTYYRVKDIVHSTPGAGCINNGHCTEWSAIWSEIKRVITKSHDREAGVRFVITSLISDQNCTTRSAISTLLHSF